MFVCLEMERVLETEIENVVMRMDYGGNVEHLPCTREKHKRTRYALKDTKSTHTSNAFVFIANSWTSS